MDGKTTPETCICALSWMPTQEINLTMVRDHPPIKNAFDWQLDISFHDDKITNLNGKAPFNIAVLLRRALDVVRRDTSKTSMSIKLKRAGRGE